MISYPVQGKEQEAEIRYPNLDEVDLWSGAEDVTQPTESSRPMVFWVFPILFILALLAMLSPGPMIYQQEASQVSTGDVQFSVTVQNTNIIIQKTVTIWCEVTTNDGNTYTQSRTVSLDQYQRESYIIIVDVPSSATVVSFDHDVYLR